MRAIVLWSDWSHWEWNCWWCDGCFIINPNFYFHFSSCSFRLYFEPYLHPLGINSKTVFGIIACDPIPKELAFAGLLSIVNNLLWESYWYWGTNWIVWRLNEWKVQSRITGIRQTFVVGSTDWILQYSKSHGHGWLSHHLAVRAPEAIELSVHSIQAQFVIRMTRVAANTRILHPNVGSLLFASFTATRKDNSYNQINVISRPY